MLPAVNGRGLSLSRPLGLLVLYEFTLAQLSYPNYGRDESLPSRSRHCNRQRFRTPYGTIQTKKIGVALSTSTSLGYHRSLGSLLLGVLNFYPQKHSSVEPHSFGFHGSVYQLDTRFLMWLITFPHIYDTKQSSSKSL